MIYRRTRASDREQIREMLKKYDLTYDEREPYVGFVAQGTQEGEDNKVIGFSYVHQAAIIDPFICESPTPAVKLFGMTMGALSVMNTNIVIAQINQNNRKLQYEMETLGFEKVDERYLVFKRVL